jgi:myosin protein heavy chain
MCSCADPSLADELSKLSDDLAAQRADMLRYKEANRLLKAKEEELRMQLEDELHSSSGWKRDRERLESRVGEYKLARSEWDD